MAHNYIAPRDVAQYAHQSGFVGTDLVTIVAICGAESGYDANARAYTLIEDSRGLAQINVWAHPWGNFINLYDPATNLDAAWRVYKEAGYRFRPWSTFTSGSYLNFWDTAVRATGNLPPVGPPAPPTAYNRPPTDVPDDYSGHIRNMTNNFHSGATSLLGLARIARSIPR